MRLLASIRASERRDTLAAFGLLFGLIGSHTILETARDALFLSKIAQIMSGDTNLKIEIEGHCDIRGSTEYNLHLGERRARAVEKYLVTQGVKADQVRVISYGEERPLDLGVTDDAHQRNRRAEIKKL